MVNDQPELKPTVGLGCLINFSKSEIWITSEGRTNDGPLEVGYGFLHLYTNFCCRVLVNTTKDNVRAELLARLRTNPDNAEDFRLLGSCYQYQLVNDQGRPTFGSFGSILQLMDGTYGPHGYQLTIEGFGLRSRKAEDQSPAAVTALTAWLMQSPVDWNSDVLRNKMLSVGPRIVQKYESNGLNISNQHDVAQSLVRDIYSS